LQAGGTRFVPSMGQAAAVVAFRLARARSASTATVAASRAAAPAMRATR